MMFIDLFALKDSTHHFSYSLAPDTIDLESEEASLKGGVEIDGVVTKHIAQTDVEGEIAAEVEVECARCLQKIAEKLKFPFSVSYVTPENYTEAKEAELRASDLEVSIFGGDKIDLNELAREQILLNLSEQTFCQKDCRGLCQKCGANRNLIDCNCEKTEIDPRWAALKNLK